MSYKSVAKLSVKSDLQLVVVSSLSLALAERMKSAATIIGVKHRSQSYFRTRDLKASLMDKTICHSYGGTVTQMDPYCMHFLLVRLTLNSVPSGHTLLQPCRFQTGP